MSYTIPDHPLQACAVDVIKLPNNPGDPRNLKVSRRLRPPPADNNSDSGTPDGCDRGPLLRSTSPEFDKEKKINGQLSLLLNLRLYEILQFDG